MKKIIITIISLIVISFLSLTMLVSKNNKYEKDTEKQIKDNYKLEDKINYLNKFDLYYIILTKNNLIILDENFEEILKEDANIIKLNKDYELVYRLNKVMYQKKKVLKNKIIYEYYDINNNELIDTVEIGG